MLLYHYGVTGLTGLRVGKLVEHVAKLEPALVLTTEVTKPVPLGATTIMKL